jgi:tocopherol O-methyltransferase
LVTLTPASPPNPAGRHYNALDLWYRALWGDHLHHGLWNNRTRGWDEARDNLLRAVADAAALQPGERLCDVGCGYGGPARWLAAATGASVVGITNSPVQAAFARSAPAVGVEIRLADWRVNDFPDCTFDAVLALESLAHFEDPAAAIAEMVRVAKPDGRLVVATWISRENPPPWASPLLLDPIRAAGELPGLAGLQSYRTWLTEAGAREVSVALVGDAVRPTWQRAFCRACRRLIWDRSLRSAALRDPLATARLAASAARVWLSYRLGLLDYAIFTCER